MQETSLTAKSLYIDKTRRSFVGRLRACLHRRHDAGQSMVEFALCLPVMLLVVTAVYAFGVTLHHYLVLSDAVSVGTRYLAISRGQTTDPCSTLSTAVFAAAPNLTPANITFSYQLNNVAYSGTSCSSTSTTTGSSGNLVQGSTVQVTATYPCSLAVYGKNYAPTCNLSTTTTELVQ